MRTLRWMTTAVLALGLAGCAGGWKNGPPSGSTSPAPPPAATPAAAAATPGGAGGTTFTWNGEGQTVHIAGDFNDWSTSADALIKQADGSWAITKNLDAGRYMYKFVIDGGTWKTDSNAAESADDGFGGTNSVVVVAQGSGGAGAMAAAVAGTATAAMSGKGGATFVWKGEGGEVHVAGDFNDWSTSADPLVKQADGSWTLTKQLAPGRYMYKFVIDGGTWKEDPNATETADDGFGGMNSVAVVGGGATPSGTGASGEVAAGAAAVGAGAAVAAGTGAKASPPEVTPEGVRFTFAGSHQSVHVAGEFNSWSTTADAMTKGADGLWTIVVKLEPGTYGYKFVVNGSDWKTDPANPESADDGFGGKNSVVEVK